MHRNHAVAQDELRKQTNAQKAKEAAARLFPGEKWVKVEAGIYLSPRRPVGEKTNYAEELRDAQILRSFGSTVYLVQEDRRIPGNKYDAIVDGEKMEFKNPRGNENTLQSHFLKSRLQAPNVFSTSTSPLSQKMSALQLFMLRGTAPGMKRRINSPAV